MTLRPHILRAPYHACSITAILVSRWRKLVEAGIDARTFLLVAGAVLLLAAGSACG